MAVVLDDEKLGQIRRKKILLGREGRPEELGPLVVYLVSPASDYMTGKRSSSMVANWPNSK